MIHTGKRSDLPNQFSQYFAVDVVADVVNNQRLLPGYRLSAQFRIYREQPPVKERAVSEIRIVELFGEEMQDMNERGVTGILNFEEKLHRRC